ncbi:FAD-dependent monooxygenase [Arthrobacter bambusae]|uniref:FAD-dependent monooxygenase n=1 Tax=Arthrobacter bambusae TaxID=1338426 RepID=UPI001F50A015|nr:NAD(P)/FAD-dependent oxidoreductase [Arthrobacter bambusae]MCI0144193.1 FAD-dependent monooxygenase [Arthrobacter bambusae]
MAAKKRHVQIAGAGFVGLTLATALARRGWSVTVHEQSESLRDFGAGILIWRNALVALEQIGVSERIRDGGLWPETYDTDLNGKRVSSELRGYPYRAVARPALYSYLVDAAREAGVELLTGSRVVGAQSAGRLLRENGETLEADLVVGADGVGSAVRNSITDFVQERRSYRDGVVRVLVDRPEEFKGLEWNRVIDFWTLEPDAMRILFIPVGPDKIYMGMMSETSNERASQLPIDVETWSERFPHLAPVIKLAEHVTGGRHDSYQTNRVSTWSAGRVAIVGDAANAMCPALGQGASVGMVNAIDMAAALDEFDDIEVALQAWESRQRTFTDLTQEISGRMAETRGMAGGNGFSEEVLWIAGYVAPGTPDELVARYPVPVGMTGAISADQSAGRG